jgi:glucose-6-phosphate isomerase
MAGIKVDLKNTGIDVESVMEYSEKVEKIDKELKSKSNDLNEFVGWLELPSNYDKEEFDRIKKSAEKIRNDSEVFVCIGIGGSYLGARAVIEALSNNFEKNKPEIMYAGNNLDSTYIREMIDAIGDRDVSINVISKSGTTTEPAIAFRIFRELLENKYGMEEARKRIYVTTDKERGALKKLSNEEEYETFVIPDNVGGRYSVLTAVGLLPIAVAGVNIDELMMGARTSQNKYSESNLNTMNVINMRL